MARVSLTGPLPEDRGARMAVFAARHILKKWTETRVDQAVRSIDVVVENWKRDNNLTGLAAALVDAIDVMLVIESDQETAPALKDMRVDERVALVILSEAMNRPHVATKGGAALAVYATSAIEIIGEMYDTEWLPHIRVGVKVRRGASKGQEIAYGSQDEKIQRRREQCTVYAHYLETTKQKTLAKEMAAEQCGVSVRTIERSLKRQRKGKF